MPTKRLLPLELFAPIFEKFRGQKVSLTEGVGWNPGDLLIYRAAEQLCRAFGICYDRDMLESDHCLLFGGGNMLGPYAEEIKLRNQFIVEALHRQMSITLLPQSFFAAVKRRDRWSPSVTSSKQGRPGTATYERIPQIKTIYVREKASQSLVPDSILVPDLVLGYEFPNPDPGPTKPVHHVIRRDLEGIVAQRLVKKTSDPIRMKNPAVYLAQALAGEKLYTDRLHVAITALAYGRDVTLIGNSYHKNVSMFETWLEQLGCHWLDPVDYCNLFPREEILA